jgi:hypothetical protein
MKNTLIVISLCFLTACSSLGIGGKPETAIEYRTVNRSAPAELYDIPPYPKLVLTPETKQSDIALWIVDLEEYSLNLEGKIKALKEFFEAPIEVK